MGFACFCAFETPLFDLASYRKGYVLLRSNRPRVIALSFSDAANPHEHREFKPKARFDLADFESRNWNWWDCSAAADCPTLRRTAPYRLSRGTMKNAMLLDVATIDVVRFDSVPLEFLVYSLCSKSLSVISLEVSHDLPARFLDCYRS